MEYYIYRIKPTPQETIENVGQLLCKNTLFLLSVLYFYSFSMHFEGGCRAFYFLTTVFWLHLSGIPKTYLHDICNGLRTPKHIAHSFQNHRKKPFGHLSKSPKTFKNFDKASRPFQKRFWQDFHPFAIPCWHFTDFNICCYRLKTPHFAAKTSKTAEKNHKMRVFRHKNIGFL